MSHSTTTYLPTASWSIPSILLTTLATLREQLADMQWETRPTKELQKPKALRASRTSRASPCGDLPPCSDWLMAFHSKKHGSPLPV